MDYHQRTLRQIRVTALALAGICVLCGAIFTVHYVMSPSARRGRQQAEAAGAGALPPGRAAEGGVPFLAPPAERGPETGAGASTALAVQNPFAAPGETAAPVRQEVPAFFSGAAPAPAAVGRLAAHLQDAADLFEAGSFAEALAQCEQAARIYPHPHAGIEALRGFCQARLGNLVRAAHHLTRALQLAPTYVACYEQLGLVYYDQQRLADAESVFLGALAIAPDDAMAHANLGRIYFDRRQFEPATAHLTAFVDGGTRSLAPHELLIAALVQTGRGAEAAAAADRARALFPDAWQIDAHRAVLAALADRFDEATGLARVCLRQASPAAVRDHIESLYHSTLELQHTYRRLLAWIVQQTPDAPA